MWNSFFPKLGLVNESEITSELSKFNGTAPEGIGFNSMQVTLEGYPEYPDTYTISKITPVVLSNQEKFNSDKEYTIKIKAGEKEFSQNFDVYDYLAIDIFDSVNMAGRSGSSENIRLRSPFLLSELRWSARQRQLHSRNRPMCPSPSRLQRMALWLWVSAPRLSRSASDKKPVRHRTI